MQRIKRKRIDVEFITAVYSRDELELHIRKLTDSLSLNNTIRHHIDITISDGKTDIFMRYHPINKSWEISKNLQQDVFSGSAQLFKINDKNASVLTTKINCTAIDKAAAQKSLTDLRSIPEWLAIHTPSKQRANKRGVNKKYWLQAAVEAGQPVLVEELNKMTRFYNKDRTTFLIYSLLVLIGGGVTIGLAVTGIEIAAIVFFLATSYVGLHGAQKLFQADAKRLAEAKEKFIELSEKMHGDYESSLEQIIKHLNENQVEPAPRAEQTAVVVAQPANDNNEIEHVASDIAVPSDVEIEITRRPGF